ncbi:MAG: hydrogenase expression/formation protein HypE [Candidatus Eisenbacteria bacterium]|nr:hydrogenase expression/formation protein HypE [Candidatus Eisenbacteria bacterium]
MDRISLSLGSGGKLMRDFLNDLILKYLDNDRLNKLWDSAHLEIDGKVGFTTDSFVVTPHFFPGGDIGKLAVAGTVNDLVVSGIKPRFLSLALILEEGFPISSLEIILASIKRTALEAGVEIVTGDTKVVRKGEADGIYVNTAGIGEVIARPERIEEGDLIVTTGPPGDHSVSIMVARGEFEFEGNVESDCQPMNSFLPSWKMGAKWMRDITRGGLATILCELSEGGLPVHVEEAKIQFSPPVRAVAEILGIDPLYLASEGKAVIVVSGAGVNDVLHFLKSVPIGRNSCIIGKIGGMGKKGEVVLKTVSGGLRLLEPLTGELLPRIC